jgi:uncharacterized protein YjbJ (UPF0337 family)
MGLQSTQITSKPADQDKGEGVLDKVKGKTKEAAGAVTRDRVTKAEGRSVQTKGTAKEKKGKAKDILDKPKRPSV